MKGSYVRKCRSLGKKAFLKGMRFLPIADAEIQQIARETGESKRAFQEWMNGFLREKEAHNEKSE